MKKLAFCVLLFIGGVVYVGCDSTPAASPPEENEPDEPLPLDAPLWFELFQRSSEEAPLVEIGRVDVEAFVNPVNLDSLARTLIAFDDPSFAVQVSSEEAQEKNIAVFWVLQRLQPDDYGFVRLPSLHVSNLGESIAGKTEPMMVHDLAGGNSTFYGFFIEGIGDTPTKPVHFKLTTDQDTVTVAVDPVTNLLPLRYVLHRTAENFDLLDQADDYLEIKSRNQFANDSTAFRPLLVFNGIFSRKKGPRREWREMGAWAPTSGWSSDGLMLTDDLQLYVIMLEGL